MCLCVFIPGTNVTASGRGKGTAAGILGAPDLGDSMVSGSFKTGDLQILSCIANSAIVNAPQLLYSIWQINFFVEREV